MNFVFLARAVDGISFDVYTEKASTFKLADQGRADAVKAPYEGEIPAETWTTLTITRDMCKLNNEVYKDKTYTLAIEVNPNEEKYYAREVLYIDNIKLLISAENAVLGAEAQAFMSENNMTAYAYKAIRDDLSATLYEGNHTGNWTKMTSNDLPYIAYRGNYGAGSYAVVDFTGKNIPQFCFFAKNITPSLLDGQDGFYIHTGMLRENGEPSSPHDCGRVTFFGPTKMVHGTPDNYDRVGPQHGYKTKTENGETIVTEETSPMSLNGLVDGVHYRYVAGIKSVSAGNLVVELLLINLDTNQEVVRYTTAISGSWITESYATGSIVMYGGFNRVVNLDKIYSVYTGVSNVYAIDKVSEILG